MKIQLLLPAGEIHRNGTGIFKRELRYAPLTLTTLAALIPDELNVEVAIQDEGVQPLNLDFEADLVGLSAITGTAPRTYAVADELKLYGAFRPAYVGVRPGVTGYWQINGRSDVGFPERAELDGYYYDHRSLRFDLRILARTVMAVAFRRGAH